MVATRLLTVEEFAAMPLEGRWELVEGELSKMTPTGGDSGGVSANVVAELANHVRPGKLGWVFAAETGFVLFADQSTVRSPDAAFIFRNRLEKRPQGFVPLPPDLAVEVLSPSDRMADALGKVGMYLDAGVRLIWLVDPAARTVTIFRANAPTTTLHHGDTLDGGDVLPDFSVPVASLFE